MLERLSELKNGVNSVSELTEYIRQGIPSAVFGVTDAFKYFLASQIEDKVLYVTRDAVSAYAAAEAITAFSGKKAVYIPPKDENLLITRAHSKDNEIKRTNALYESEAASCIVVTIETLLCGCPKKSECLTIVKGERFERDDVVKLLVGMNYKRVEAVEDKGTFAVRGDVLDVFAINSDEPIRIDFFDDEIENVKIFDHETRKNLGAVTEAVVLPNCEYRFTEEDFAKIKAEVLKDVRENKAGDAAKMRTVADDVLTAIDERNCDILSSFASLCDGYGDLFDRLDGNAVIVLDEPKRIKELAELTVTEFTERFNAMRAAGEAFGFAKNNFKTVERVTEDMNKYRLAAMQNLSSSVAFFNPLKIVTPTVSAVSNYRLDFKEVYGDIKNWLFSGYTVLACAGSRKRADKFVSDLSDNEIAVSGKPRGVTVSAETLPNGFVFHETKTAVIGSGNLFVKPQSVKRTSRKKNVFFTAPEVGDYCVHEIHGIGRVLGNKKISTTEGTKDYVAVEYAKGDILYVPVEQMDILTRYLGGERKPKLSDIGGKDFERIKKQVKESIKKMSFDLKKLYEERNSLTGHKFAEERELQELFEDAFPFEETPDQEAANADIKKDMTSGKVMDRLVCGDVGFGKTEVAFRAVFRAVADGKQAAMLAPTTILAEQHYNTALERFKGFGVRIAALNRFKKPAEQKVIIEKLKKGEIDFVIGTHRLLSKDVGFFDLGLLVLDEEQRFGVEHKERIKLMKKNVDTLTLTATPIPRTLHMSLSGIRAISTINTPPKKRLPVQTFVTEQTDALIKDAVTREINRGGQAFILYNRVDGIFKFATEMQNLLGDVKITVVHGQMDESTMEKNILTFYRGESDVLVSTTIIENGVDLPRANTLIVIDADRLGLSTLYQLKGRVGRSNRLAYAYFTFKRDKILSDTAFERLNAITDFTEMGSGIKIAMRDLEIRGAGNVLGAEQHGHMDKVGYELYSKLLKEELTGEEEVFPELDIRVTAYIPERYIESNVSRMDAYKQIAEIVTKDDERDFIAYAEETFGKLPIETVNLINIAVVKRMAMKFGASEINVKKEEVSLVFENFKVFADGKLADAVDASKGRTRISVSGKPKIEFAKREGSNADMLAEMRLFLEEATV